MNNSINKEINKIKKELYLKESIKYFDEKGFKNSKVSELAKLLEISIGTIYNIFNSKEELYLEYLIFKLKVFIENLKRAETNKPLENLEIYLKYKYEIFIQIDKNNEKTLINDPYFFHKLDIVNHPIVNEIYKFLSKQFKLILPESKYSHNQIAILFKKFSDGFIESYIIEKYDTTNIIDNTINIFLHGLIKK